jgi:hypothetical protein
MQSEIRPMYSLLAISLLLRNALNYGMDTDKFIIECNASSGFKITYQNPEKDYYEVINAEDKVLINSKPIIDFTKNSLKYSEINNNIYSFKSSFDQWLRSVYLIHKTVSSDFKIN